MAASPVTRESAIVSLQEMVRKAGGRRIRRYEFERDARIPRHQILRLFGSYGKLLQAAGIATPRNARIDDDVLLRALRDMCLARGGVVGRAYMVHHGRYSPGPYERRWGRWREVLVALREWVERHDPGFAHLADLPQAGTGEAPRLLARPMAPPLYGAPIHYRGIRHEPINEAGVVMLFGAMAEELGFAVERVTAAFPDCEAKRQTPQGWQRTRIEFEYRSRNFIDHAHDPAGCDMIVCWEHNWPECPLEVLELKAAVAARSRPA